VKAATVACTHMLISCSGTKNRNDTD
jgi:hypothetical protein